MPRSHFGVALLLLAALPLLACRPADQIETYNVPKGQPQARPLADSAPAAAPMMGAAPAVAEGSRMIAGMLRGDRQAWFFKVVGTPSQIEAIAEPVRGFLKTIEFDKQAGRPVWKTPQGWQTKGQSGMRLDTLIIPTADGPLELTVIGLGLTDDWDALVRSNVDRWRRQIGLKPMSDDDFGALSTTRIDQRELVVVDLSQNKPAAPARDAGMGAGVGVGVGASEGAVERAPASTGPSKGPIAYEIPDGWNEKPATSMRLANLVVGEGEDRAEVTVFAFSAQAPAMADPLANVNRWRGEIGMPPTTQEDLDKQLESIDVGGLDCKYIELTPEEGAERTLAAMGTRGQQVWFFKMRGAGATVDAERDHFREWLAGIRFTGQ